MISVDISVGNLYKLHQWQQRDSSNPLLIKRLSTNLVKAHFEPSKACLVMTLKRTLRMRLGLFRPTSVAVSTTIRLEG
jgi:hypothetical protein